MSPNVIPSGTEDVSRPNAEYALESTHRADVARFADTDSEVMCLADTTAVP